MLTAPLLLALMLAALGVAQAQNVSEQQAAKETYIDGLRLLDAAALEPRLGTLGINIGYVERDTRPGGGRYFCGAVSRDASRAIARSIAPAFAKLPDASLRRLRLRYVILCSRAMAGTQRIGGIPVPPLDLLMLDVGEGGTNPGDVQHLFLHELYHLIEYRFNTYEDAQWRQRFGAGYAESYGERMNRSAIGSGRPGFLNAYSETYPHEERAELFALLLLEPAVVATHLKRTNDPVLRDKVRYVIEKCERLLGLRLAY